MNGLALCAGVGGLELGLGIAIPEHRTRWAFDTDEAARDVLARRFPDTRIEGDFRDYDFRPIVGAVGILSAGFPCQPWSAAGRRSGVDDPRWLWPDIAEAAGECAPRMVFLENSPRVDLGPILESLDALGFNAAWDRFSAAQSGAPHRRQRTFLLAHAHGFDIREQPWWRRWADREVATEFARPLWWSREPEISRVDDGTPDRMVQHRLVGNGVVPAVAARAFITLARRLADG